MIHYASATLCTGFWCIKLLVAVFSCSLHNLVPAGVFVNLNLYPTDYQQAGQEEDNCLHSSRLFFTDSSMLSEVYIPLNQILCKLYCHCPDSKNFCFYRTNFLSKKHTSQLTAPQDKIVINVLSLYFSHYKIQSVQNYMSAYIGPNILQNSWRYFCLSACLSMIMLLLLLKDYLDLSVWQQENKQIVLNICLFRDCHQPRIFPQTYL